MIYTGYMFDIEMLRLSVLCLSPQRLGVCLCKMGCVEIIVQGMHGNCVCCVNIEYYIGCVYLVFGCGL